MMKISRECALFLQRSLTPPGIGAVPEYVADFERYSQELSIAIADRSSERTSWKPGDPRCDFCDNGLNSDWAFCPYCSRVVDSTKSVERSPTPLSAQARYDPTTQPYDEPLRHDESDKAHQQLDEDSRS